MNKFDGLDIENKFSEPENQFDSFDFSEDELNQFSQSIVEEKIVPLVYKNKKRKNKGVAVLKALTLLFGVGVTIFCGYKGHLAPVKTFLNSEYNYSEKNVLGFDEIKYTIFEWFNITPAVNLNNLDVIEIKKPFVAMDIVEENGNLIFKNLESVFLRMGVDGKVSNISDTLGGRRVEVLCSNGCTLVYSGLTYIGTEKNKTLKAGDLFGASNGDVVMSLFFKGEKINLKLDENGKIVWQN